ncbi:hypothetical protein BH10PSE14_BH10PSE14_27740 [soil metagenome]
MDSMSVNLAVRMMQDIAPLSQCGLSARKRIESGSARPAFGGAAVRSGSGPMWAYRWARARQVKVDGRLEQEPPAWIGAYAGGASK